MKCKACGCEDRWVGVEYGGFCECECGHAQEVPGCTKIYQDKTEEEKMNYQYGQLSNKYAKLKYDYDILLKRFNNLKEKEK